MLEQTRRNIYRNFCQKEALPVFVQDWFLDAVCQSGEWDFVYVEEKGEVVGVQPYFFKKKFNFTYITMPIGAKYMGPFLLSSKNNLADQHRIYEKLIQQLPKVDNFRQNFHPDVTNWLPFYWQNFQQTTHYTYRLNVEQPEAIYRSLSENTRYKLRKANKILEITDQLSAEEFHEVHQMTFDRQRLPTPLSLNDFLNFDKVMVQHQARKMFFAVDKAQNIHAVLYILLDKHTAYMHFMASHPKFPKSEAMNFTIWHFFQSIYKENGISMIDFEGSMMKNVENICRRFRSQQHPYFSITKEESKWFKLIQSYLKSKK